MRSCVSRVLRTALVTALLPLASCALFTTKTLPEDPPRDRISECSTSRAPAIVDVAVGGAAAGFMGFIAVKNADRSGESQRIALAFGVGALASAALFGWSALHGFLAVDRCERYRAEMLGRPDLLGEPGGACLPDGTCSRDGLHCVAGVCAFQRPPATRPSP